MNKVTSRKRHHPSKDEHSNNTDGKQVKLQDTVSCQSTGDNGFVISSKQNVSNHINDNRSKNFTLPGWFFLLSFKIL